MDSVFGPIFDAIAWLLAQFYSVVPDLGISIILLTITIMLLLYPLTAKQAKSMMAMQRVQPEIKKLQAKYKGDRAKLNEEMMKFYQENKINPLAGCLPLLVQMPIFISLFNVLRNSYKYVPTSSKLHAALCHGFGTKCGDVATNSAFPGFKTGDTLVHHLGFIDKGFLDLRLTATDSHGSLLSASPYFALVIFVMLTGFLQSRQAQRRTPQANKQMAMVMKVLPIFFGLISLNFPAGLVLYFFVSNLWRLGQQELIFRRHGSALTPAKGALDVKSTERSTRANSVVEIEAPETEPDEVPAAVPAPAPPPKAKTPGQPREAVRPAQRAGGLRGMFSLPPPPEFNGGGAATAANTAPRTSSTSGSASAAAAAERATANRRRRNKKKRKR